jgi:branched-chain amino acid transport system permease protein
MDRFLNLVWAGLWLGSAYGAIAVGLVACFRSARLVNISVGAFFVFAGMLMQWLLGHGWAVGLAALAAILAVVVLSVAQERVILRPIAGATPSILLLGSLAVSLTLSGVCAVWFGRDPVTGPGIGHGVAVQIGPWHTNLEAILLLVGGVAITAVGWCTLERSAMGRAITAVGADPGAAQMLGIDVWRLRIAAMAFAGLAAGIGGVLFVPLGILDFSQGLPFLLYGFVAASLAGFMSIPWTFAASLGFGVVSSLGTAYISSVFAQAVSFGILALLVLVSQTIPGLKQAMA